MIAIDFETFYGTGYSLTKLGTCEYVEHPKFNAYLVSLYGTNIEYVGPVEKAPWHELADRVDFCAHNVSFDRAVFERLQRMAIIPAELSPVWTCTADMVAYFQLPRSLAGACRELFASNLDKQVRADMRNKLPDALNRKQLEALYEYALEDAKWCYKLWMTLAGGFPKNELLLSRHGISSGLRGIKVNRSLLQSDIERLQMAKENLESKIPWADRANKVPIASVLQIKAHCKSQNIEPPKSTASGSQEFEAWQYKNPDQEWARTLQQWRSINKHLRSCETVLRRSKGGTMPFQTKYFGAAITGRWSGSTGFNMQNIPRDEVFGVNLRRHLTARPGHKFIHCDLSQIEPRILAWLSEDYGFLNYLREGMDPYEAHARATMKYVSPEPLATVDKKMRQIAKVRVLALGYGAAGPALKDFATKMGMDMTDLEAAQIVNDYRRESRHTTALWNKLGRAFKVAATQRLDIFKVELKSGRTLNYYAPGSDLKASAVPGGTAFRWWGGKLVENLVQATARDYFADRYAALLRCGYNVIWTVHDEVIVEAENDLAERYAESIKDIMKTPPEWASGLPVDAHYTIASHYIK